MCAVPWGVRGARAQRRTLQFYRALGARARAQRMPLSLASVRRFDMAWMMAGKPEKKAAGSLFLAAAVSDPCEALSEAAKKYGVEI